MPPVLWLKRLLLGRTRACGKKRKFFVPVGSSVAPKRVSGIKLVVFSQHNDALNDVSFPLTLHYDEFLSFSAIFGASAAKLG